MATFTDTGTTTVTTTKHCYSAENVILDYSKGITFEHLIDPGSTSVVTQKHRHPQLSVLKVTLVIDSTARNGISNIPPLSSSNRPILKLQH